MLSILVNLARSLRHAVVGLAILVVLTMSMRVHVHAASAEAHGQCHDHGAGVTLGSIFSDDDAPTLPDLADPEDCGHCHCHCACASVMVPESAALALPLQESSLAGHIHAGGLPESRSYPPDPPPVRLG